MVKSLMLAVFIIYLFSCAKGAYVSPIAYTLPDGLQSVSGSSSIGDCEEHCIMTPISGTAINGRDCPGNTPASGVLVDGVIPSIDTTQRETWASELLTVNRSERDSITIGFDLPDFSLRGIEVVLFQCPVQRTGITGVKVYSSFLFPTFSISASKLLFTHSPPPSDNCQSLSTISIPVQPTESPDIYFVKFLFTGGSSVHQLNWLYLGEIRFSDMDILSFTTSSEHHITTTNRGTPITQSPDETSMSQSGSGPLEPGDEYTGMETTLPNSIAYGTSFTNSTTLSSEPLLTGLGSTDVPIISIVGGLAGIIAILLLLVIIGGTFMAYLVVLHRRNLKSDSPLEYHYAAIGNPNIDNAPSLELQHLNNPGGEERRPSTAINSLYEPTTETNDHASSNTLLTSVTVHVPSGDVIYSEIRDILGVYDYSEGIAEDQAQDTSGVDFYDDDDDDDDDDIIHENHYTIIPEMYILATPINQVKLNIRPKSADVSQTAHVASLICVSEAQNHENYSLVHKQSECAPPVPEKSIELQQCLTEKMTAATEEKDQQKDCRGQIDASESGTQTE